MPSLVGSEMCIRDSLLLVLPTPKPGLLIRFYVFHERVRRPSFFLLNHHIARYSSRELRCPPDCPRMQCELFRNQSHSFPSPPSLAPFFCYPGYSAPETVCRLSPRPHLPLEPFQKVISGACSGISPPLNIPNSSTSSSTAPPSPDTRSPSRSFLILTSTAYFLPWSPFDPLNLSSPCPPLFLSLFPAAASS